MNKEKFWELFDEKKLKSVTVDIYGNFIRYTLNEETGKYESKMGSIRLTFEPKDRSKFEILDYELNNQRKE